VKKIVLGAAMALAVVTLGGESRAAACANPCTTPQVNIVYFGATAPNQAINQAMTSLYGDPVNTCTSVIKVYRCMRDLDLNGTPETCVQAYVGDNKGSCEGVDAMDNKSSAFNVCDPAAAGAPNSGSGGLKSAGLINDEAGHPLYANYSGSDVAYSLCEPVVTGGVIQRPSIFDDTEQNVFVNGFVFIVNRAIEGVLDPRGKSTPGASCPYGVGDCVQPDLTMSPARGQAIFGNNNLCDYRWMSKDIDPTVARNIGTVMRNRLSGTRRNLNVTVLQNGAPGQGNIYEAGSGGVVTDVNTNLWCGNTAAKCGENQATGVTGGGAISAACTGSNANTVAMGYLGVDRIILADNGTPADPHDDVPARNNVADNYDPIKYEGVTFNKANVRCGRYNYWSIEKNYYDNDANVAINGRVGYFFPAGSIRDKAIKELINQVVVDATTDPTLVPLPDMYFTRARDGAAPFPNKPYNVFCDQP
jgi:hypothetical protein